MSRIRFPADTSYHAAWVVRDDAGDLVNLTGYVLAFAVYFNTENQWGAPIPWLEKTIGSGVTLTDAVEGTVQVDFDPDDTQDKAGVYPWELKFTTTAGESRLIDKGWLVLSPARLQVVP